MMYAIPEESLKLIINTIASFDVIEQAVIFGSRAKANNKKGSDVDIAIKGDKITINDLTRLSSILNEEIPLPYFFDILDYKAIKNEELKEHIDRAGKVIYTREF